MVKVKTVIKGSLFIILFVGLLIFLFTGEDSDDSGMLPTTPVVPEVPTEEDADVEDPDDVEGGEVVEGDEVPIDIPPPPEQIGLDDTQLENRPLFIENTQESIEGHDFLLANDDYEMYFKEENLSIIMRDKHTGAVMYSTIDDPVESNEEWTNFMQSSFVLEYLVGTNIVVYRADMYSGDPDKKVTYLDDGFSAKISYPEIEISFEVQVRLADEGFNVEVLQDNIEENNERYKVAGLYVYPFLGYSKLGEREGYMFIPDGSGGLIHLKDNDGKYKQPYSEMVYGGNVGIDDAYVLSLFNRMNPFNEPEDILAPVFGMVQTDSRIGYLGIIEEGEFSAKIEAYPSGAILPYNWITSRFIYRQVYNQPTSQDTGSMVVRQKDMNNFDIRVRYDFVSEEKADYVGLAERYRDYLLDHQLITQKEDEFKTRVDFFGSDVEKGLVFKKDIPMTTFSQASDILNDLQRNGVADILSVYKGWQDNGYYGGLPIRSFTPESKLSGELTIQELLDESQQKDIELFLYHDALRINTEEIGNTKYKVMKKFNKRTYDEGVYGQVYRTLNYLNPQSTVNILEQMKQKYAKENVEHLMIGGISNELFSYSEGNKEFDRIQTKELYESIIADYHHDLQLMLEQPYAYLWDYTSRIIDLPTRSSNYVFTDEDIPFLALTLKGIVPLYAEYTNFQANQVEFFLQLVEQGLNPSFYITHEDPSDLLYTNSSHIYSSKYDRYDEMIQTYDEELKDVHEQTKGSMIHDYERVDGVTKVTYDNGTIVYVNYQEDHVEIDGQTVEGLSYKVVTDH